MKDKERCILIIIILLLTLLLFYSFAIQDKYIKKELGKIDTLNGSLQSINTKIGSINGNLNKGFECEIIDN